MVIGVCILEDEVGVSTIEVPPDVGPKIKATASSQMEAAMAALSAELSKLRTGRASAGILMCVINHLSVKFNTQHTTDGHVSTGMLDHIIVETGGMKMTLNRVALVSVLDPKTLSVNPYDPQVYYLRSWSMLFIKC